MSALRSLQLAIEMAGAQRDQAQTHLQQAHQAEAFACAQMQQLTDYLQETEQRWMSGARKSIEPELLHHHYQFVARLSQAIEMQAGVLKDTRQRVNLAQQELLKKEQRLASFKQLMQKRLAAIAQRQQRVEQKQMDEFAALLVQHHHTLQAEAT